MHVFKAVVYVGLYVPVGITGARLRLGWRHVHYKHF